MQESEHADILVCIFIYGINCINIINFNIVLLQKYTLPEYSIKIICSRTPGQRRPRRSFSLEFHKLKERPKQATPPSKRKQTHAIGLENQTFILLKKEGSLLYLKNLGRGLAKDWTFWNISHSLVFCVLAQKRNMNPAASE